MQALSVLLVLLFTCEQVQVVDMPVLADLYGYNLKAKICHFKNSTEGGSIYCETAKFFVIV